ncbi:D-2-hydroxyacid dehydrogenase [Paenibacillus sp. LHD-38]|uniref:D-2-hydroxyacid dehydrogenase n=1 Tax=Paenibacillus sp. LHD-38 TaxID=3072143 RepID=UPI00280CE483|nr:D-2-hydroxyacid dehydrogenase [Paenibacillus sp. LHD-38]MDQ8737938.1 D-2-hydroxyacid dehydrogenase [Paenibacillus sp. LHD-38]
MQKSLVLGHDTPLRWVQCWGAGVDQMPLETFARKGILLSNASGVHAFPVSETVFAMMLAFARRLHVTMRNQMSAKWQSPGSLQEIHGKTAAIIGLGAIGEETARLAKAFGMKVLGIRRTGAESSHVDRMYDIGRIMEVLGQSDYVIVTLPLTDETRHMFGHAQFRAMKPSAYFINIGRGGTTDTDALEEALRKGIIAGAGLDVFEEEPLPAVSPLWEMENVILTPHISGLTVNYEERVMDIFLSNLQEYLGGRSPFINRIDLVKQY